MTAAELKALDVLGKRFDDFREDNQRGHEDIKVFIKDVETRLTAKICTKDQDIKAIIAHCKEREISVDAALARGLVATDAHIAAAKIEAVNEATKPSIYAQATKGALDGLLRFSARAAVVVGLVGACWALLEKTGVF